MANKIQPHPGLTHEMYKKLSKEDIKNSLKPILAQMHYTRIDGSGNIIAEGKVYEYLAKEIPPELRLNIDHLAEDEYRKMKEDFELEESDVFVNKLKK